MLDTLLTKFRELGAYTKRGIIYISVSVLFLGYEIFFHNPPRPTVAILWLGVIVIAISIIVSLKDPER